MLIEKSNMKFDIDIKRFYAPFKIHTKCKNEECGKIFTKDFNLDYFSYPSLNEPIEEYLYCDECDEEHEFKLLLKLDLEVLEHE